MEEKLLKIINHYGVNKQLRQFNEEQYELKEAITIHETEYMYREDFEVRRLNFPEHTIYNITQEIADCQVMLEQFRLYYGIEQEEIENIMNDKIERQLKRIETQKNIKEVQETCRKGAI